MTTHKESKCCEQCSFTEEAFGNICNGTCPCHKESTMEERDLLYLIYDYGNTCVKADKGDKDAKIKEGQIIEEIFTKFSQEKSLLLEEVGRLLEIYSVNAPEESRAATFTPKQFLSLLSDHKEDK